VEDSDISHEISKECLEILLKHIESNVELNGVEVWLEFHDTRNDFDHETVVRCIEDYGENFFFKRWEVKFEHLTHKQLDVLVEKLKNTALSYNNVLFDIYSES